MCRGLPLEVLSRAPGATKEPKAASQQAGVARPPQYDDIFLQYMYKVVPCDKNHRHDYATCPFSHPGEASERRHPSAYLPFMCGNTQHSTDLKEKCPFGTACKYAHGHFELWLHPGRFRTKMCSLGENCRRAVCFFAHSEQELRVTPYSKLDTGAAAAAEQLAQMQQEQPLAFSTEAASIASSISSIAVSNPSKTAVTYSTPCGSEVALSMQSAGSPCSSVTAAEDFSCVTAGMVLGNVGIMPDMQLQCNALALAANDASLAAVEVAAAAAAAAPSSAGLWLAGSTGMLQQQQLLNCSANINGLLPQQTQQLVLLNNTNQLLSCNPSMLQQADLWMQPSAPMAPAASRLAEQWPAYSMGAQQCQAPFGGIPAGLPTCNSTPMQCLAAPSGVGLSGVEQLLQMGQWYGMLAGANVGPVGCGMAQQPTQPAINSDVARLLSTLPEQRVQQLLSMLAVESQ